MIIAAILYALGALCSYRVMRAMNGPAGISCFIAAAWPAYAIALIVSIAVDGD